MRALSGGRAGNHSARGDLRSASKGLQTDGLTSPEQKPKALTRQDVAGALRVVAFCPLPEAYSGSGMTEHCDDVPAVGDDYSKARDTIVEHVKTLLDALAGGK